MAGEAEYFLRHFSSANYDPVKAHEYYLQKRELEGNKSPAKNESKEQRASRVATSQKQREALTYANKQIGDKKKAETNSAQAAQQARLEALRKNAEASRDRITAKLNKFLEELTSKATPVQQVPLNPIPANATPKRRAYLEKQNAIISQNNKAATDKAAVELASKKNTAQKAASEEMRRVGTEMKLAVANARESYAASKKQIQDKYKAVSDTEQKNIKANVR